MLISFFYIFFGIFFALGAQTPLQMGWELLEKTKVWEEGIPEEVILPENYKWREVSAESVYESTGRDTFLLRIPVKNIARYKDPHILLPKNSQAWKVFWDGKEIYHFSGPEQFEPAKFLGWVLHIFPIEKKEIKNSYIYLLFYTGPQVRVLIPILDEKENIIQKLYSENLIALFSISISIFLGIVIFIVSLVRKMEAFYSSLALFFLGIGIWMFLTNPISEFVLSISPWRLRLEYFSLYIAPIGAIWFLETIIVSRFNLVLKILRYIMIIYTFLAFTLDLVTLFPLWKTLYPFDTIVLVGTLLFTVQILRGAFKGEWESRILAPGLLSVIVCAIHDSLQVLGFLEQGRTLIMHFGVLAFIISMSCVAAYRVYLLNWHLKATADELREKNIILKLINEEKDDLNQNLEIKVIERTQDLYQTMEDIKALKVQQDADYYLTSILIKPLSRNRNISPFYKTEVMTLQKKVFEFRSKKWELGGDISIIENIYFHTFSNRYIFFFNGDAMGKSMQGAGGAIVAGTSLNHILNKTNNTGIPIQKTPEAWLESLYWEMNSIFQTFDGYMLLTAICGVLEEKTGKLIWFNADHTKSILFQDRAFFFPNEIFSAKLGSKSSEGPKYNYHEMKAGETLLVGSDGKDELEIILSNGGFRFNQEEDFFLKIVDDVGVDLDRLLGTLLQRAKLADDISLVSIHRLGTFFS